MHQEKTAATPDAGHGAAEPCRAKVNALYAGTEAMRAAGVVYLPRDGKEHRDDYEARLMRNVLFPGVRKTVRDMTGKVFAKPIVIGDDVPKPIVTAAENIDFAGQHLNVFAASAFKQSIRDGIGYIFVDMPPKPDSERTRADEIAAGRRPYFVHVTADNLIGLRSTTINGQEELTQVRILEAVTEPDGEFHEKAVQQVRVVSKGETGVVWTTYRKDADGKWVEHANGTMNVSRIPLAPIYINRTGFYRGSPPLEDLADLNIAHWQTRADLRTILYKSNFPILLAAGFTDADKIEFTPGSFIKASNKDAKISWAEHTGACIDKAQDELKALKVEMEAIGLRLVTEKVASSATEAQIDDDQNTTPLAMMAEALKDGIEMSFAFMAEFMGLGAYGSGVGGSVTVNTEFGVKRMETADLTALQSMRNAGDLSLQSYHAELKRRDVLADDFNSEADRALIEAEGPVVMGFDGEAEDRA